MADGLNGHSWVNAVSPSLGEVGIQEFLALWEVAGQTLLTEGEDTFRWAWSSSGMFTARSAYLAFFAGRINRDCVDLIWDSKAPMRC